jgi:hypothetical protein
LNGRLTLSGRNHGVDLGGNLGYKVKTVGQQGQRGHASGGAALRYFGLRHLARLDCGGSATHQPHELGAGILRHFTDRSGHWCGRERGGRYFVRRNTWRQKHSGFWWRWHRSIFNLAINEHGDRRRGGGRGAHNLAQFGLNRDNQRRVASAFFAPCTVGNLGFAFGMNAAIPW